MTENLDPMLEAVRRFLAEPEGKKIFQDAVTSALQSYRGFGCVYNIDSMESLSASIESYKYASVHMVNARRFPRDPHGLLKFAAGSITRIGPILEFGVFRGASINFLASIFPALKMFGFDSFEGLPEAWSGTPAMQGAFSLQGQPPSVRDNVELVEGWFSKTLPSFLDDHKFPEISLLHVDCDLYSSTQTIFANLYERIVPGTIIVFDEYFNYPGWEKHEFLAFQEFVNFRRVRYEYIGLVPEMTQVAVRIL